MRVRAKTAFSLGGGLDVFPGDVFDLEESNAKLKLSMGWVELATAPGPEASPEEVEDQDAEASHREPRRRRAG